ncbi:MAG: LysR family transcriptional regulator [Clostridia bacterium]|nr:LysR family transcriptional regulator [Clostridia bacterium]
MNLQYVKYALEISRTGSISKAAENLSVAQPNLSRAVKELENQLGISIFERTRTGMTVTPEGEKLLSAGERILREVGELETMFDGESQPIHSFSMVAPPSAYLSHAFTSFCTALPVEERFSINYHETTAGEILDSVANERCKLGILRIPRHFERYYAERLTARELSWELLTDFAPVAVAGLGSPLAGCDTVSSRDLTELCELLYPDSPRPDLTASDGVKRSEFTLTERGVLWDLLAEGPSFFLFDAPMPSFVAAKHGLLQRPVVNAPHYLDLLISTKGYRLTPTDEAYLRALRGTLRAVTE